MSSDRQPAGDPVVTTAPDVGDEIPTAAEQIAAAVLEVAGVHDLHGGVIGEVATYLPGKRVGGVRLRSTGDGLDHDQAEVHIVLDWQAPALATADAVRRRVESFIDGPVHVIVEDITDPPHAGTSPETHHDSTPDDKDT